MTTTKHASARARFPVDTDSINAQARSQLQLAFGWLNKENWTAASICLDAMRKLYALTGSWEPNSHELALYHFFRGTTAAERKRFPTALRHYRKALRIYQSRPLIGPDKILPCSLNIGMALVNLGDKAKGRKLVESTLEQFKALDVDPNQLPWKERSILVATEFLAAM